MSLLRKSLTSLTGISKRQYQKYSDFKDLTPEQILELPLDQISTTRLNKDHNTKLKQNQLSAVRELIALKKLSNKGTSITPEFRKSRIDLSKQVNQYIADTYIEDIKKRELELRHKRLNNNLTEEEAVELRLIGLKKGGRRNTKKTKTQTKKRTNKQKRRTYKK